MRVIFLILILTSKAWTQTPVLDRLRAQPAMYRCSAVSGADICVTKQKISTPGFSYSKPVAIVIPRNSPPIVSADHVMMYLQGWRGVCFGGDDVNYSPEQTLQAFNLPNLLLGAIAAAGQTNAILVFPVSVGHDDTYKNELVGNFGDFANWVDSQTGSNPKAKWHLAGHSGAGAIMASGASISKNISARLGSVQLLDATYGSNARNWQTVINRNASVFIQSVYIGGSGTQAGSVELKSVLNQMKTLKYPVKIYKSSNAHCDIPAKYYQPMLTSALTTTHSFMKGISP